MAGSMDVDEQLQVSGCSTEKGRSSLFQNASRFAVTKALSSIKYSLFKQHYPECTKEDRRHLKACHKQLVIKLESRVLNELEELYCEENILSRLDQFDDVIKNCKADKSQTGWRPSGNPDKDIAAHRIKVKLEAKERLEKFLAELQLEEEELQKNILQGEAELSKLDILFEKQAIEIETAAHNVYN